jgi:hypothetical protein
VKPPAYADHFCPGSGIPDVEPTPTRTPPGPRLRAFLEQREAGAANERSLLRYKAKSYAGVLTGRAHRISGRGRLHRKNMPCDGIPLLPLCPLSPSFLVISPPMLATNGGTPSSLNWSAQRIKWFCGGRLCLLGGTAGRPHHPRTLPALGNRRREPAWCMVQIRSTFPRGIKAKGGDMCSIGGRGIGLWWPCPS